MRVLLGSGFDCINVCFNYSTQLRLKCCTSSRRRESLRKSTGSRGEAVSQSFLWNHEREENTECIYSLSLKYRIQNPNFNLRKAPYLLIRNVVSEDRVGSSARVYSSDR